MADKEYVNNIYIKTVGKFDDISLSFKVDEFVEEIKKLKNKKGYANILLKKRKEKSQYGHTHYAVVDTFTPKQDTDRVDYEDKGDVTEVNNVDDLPF